eukprot:scaffold369005_cov15-Prasinocladus_malaysianus.AAC.1
MKLRPAGEVPVRCWFVGWSYNFGADRYICACSREAPQQLPKRVFQALTNLGDTSSLTEGFCNV